MFLKNDSVGLTESRVQAYEAFRSFSRDASQEGDTLSSSSPIKFSGTKSLIAKRAYFTRLAYRPHVKVGAISLLLPPELCWSSGYIPFNWEMFASLLASHSRVIELTNKGSVPVPRCSFINSLVGAHKENILPAPDIAISSSAYCEGIAYGFNELTRNFSVPHYHIDIPGYTDDSSVQYLAGQLKEIYRSLCELNGIEKSDGEARLRKTMLNSTLAKRDYMDIYRIREEYAPLNLGVEPLHWHMLFFNNWGDETGVQIMQKIKYELLKYVQENRPKRDDGIPVGNFSLIPYGRSNIWKKLIDSNAYFAFEGINYIGEQEMLSTDNFNSYSINELFNNMAFNLISMPMRGLDMKGQMDKYLVRAKNSGVEGMIIFSHEHCQMLAPRLKMAEDRLTEQGIKVVTISGDCILGMPQGPTNIRLGTFLNALKEDKEIKEPQPHIAEEKHESTIFNDTRVGVDFGSGYSKYLVLDEMNDVLEYGVVNSGIDYPRLLEDIKAKLHVHGELKYGIAGVGGDNPSLLDLVDNQTTEISAVIKAVRHICKKHRDFFVIDIGTQDVKVLQFNEPASNPWINTNKSCGAGTGMVLAQILERWQQTNPEMTFDDLDKMASQTNDAELVNTTCGIFAVTNVVSALVQSNPEDRNKILLGVYNYIATQAIRLLPPGDYTGKSLMLTGGVARHMTLRKIFTERGFKLIELPENLHPQFVVAYGTALSV